VSLTQSQRAPRASAFTRIVRAAVAAGLLSGLLLTGLQQFQVVPLLLRAEAYEDAASKARAPLPAEAQRPAAGAHAHGADEAAHSHEDAGWKPEDGAERTTYTVLANITTAVAFGLLLSAAMFLRGAAPGWRSALLWGAAGYAVFFLAPSLGLPPEVPGTSAAPVGERQAWWLLTAAATGCALALLVLARRWPLKLAGAAILLLPHLAGAPQPLVHASAAPVELARSFIYATAFANAVFWLALAALTAFFFKKFD
jgi:cobalt transporter subunit CbtA